MVPDAVLASLQVEPLTHQAHEVLRVAMQLEADEVSAEQPAQNLIPPRHLHIQLRRGERDVQEEADANVGAQFPQHLRNQLQLVVLNPDDGAFGGGRRCVLGEPRVHRDVAVPPLTLKVRGRDPVVVERPQRGVGETLVVEPDVVCGQWHREQLQTLVLEGRQVLAGGSNAVTSPPGDGFQATEPSGCS